MKIVVGSRGSKLALRQTNWVIDILKEKFEDVEFEVKVIKTKGDKIVNVSLDKIGDKGLFVKEIEKELLEGKIDMAVHSMKDMPSEMTEGLTFSGIPKREDYRDVLVLRDGYKDIDDIPKGGRIGTGSKRRKYQLLKYRPDLEVVSIRGNVDTRIKKIENENLHGVVLAAAGLKRIGLEDKISSYLSPDIVLPAPAQGALALQIRKDRLKLDKMLKKISDRKTEIQIKAERAFLKGVGGSCHVPIGALCNVIEDRIILEGILGDEDGSKLVREKIEGKIGDEETIGYKLADKILKELK
ncbi:hydroxymethylbilane synthase [Thermohalobacter berrensis]|uniref:Porphobilinogen deaminase n=1 Tax=Thermohalobacter berrensis TaxID=99594 RepID=A0A419SZI5_9FIRM|nr:hydroxymethylbilane synthase [Thermohalobacter berrensis]RKD30622.1 hydroxymethylbilane synthase [Thermohalobacter berrensis]